VARCYDRATGGAALLVVDGLAKRFHSRTGAVDAVSDVSFSLAAGEVLGFLGPNGAGKTTTIKMVAGLVRPDRGVVRIGGAAGGTAQARRQVGAVLEGSRNLYWRLTALENLMYWGMMRGLTAAEARQRGMALLARVDLAGKAHNTLQTLSRGMQQKAALAVALVHRPGLLLLDEPTLGLDWQSGQEIQTMVRELRDEGSAILLTTHQLDVAQALSDRVAIIRGGRLVLDGETADVLARFSRPVVRVALAAPPSADVVARLTALGAAFEPDRPDSFAYAGGGGEPAAALALLQAFTLSGELAIDAITRDRANLSHVFERVLADGSAGAPAPAAAAEREVVSWQG
jgi:ABC-2 type transport system ATP-binding protein